MAKLGRYETIEELGRGGTAVVYRARDLATEREVAVKVLSSHLMHDPDLLARFEREIKLAVKLEHPHIVPILDVGTEGDHPYIVMRLLGGGSLSDRIRFGPLSAADTVRILQEVASALDEAHRLNIVHRDLKPSNILFDTRGTAYLADFGVARLMDGGDSITASAGVVGTPAYMSPEQLKGQHITGLADQYALGLVAFQALTARLPYEGSTAQMILQQLQEPLPSVRRYNTGLSPNFERVLARATAKNPSARYATASEFAAALATAAAEAPLPIIAPRPSLVTEQDIALITPPPMLAISDLTPVPAAPAPPENRAVAVPPTAPNHLPAANPTEPAPLDVVVASRPTPAPRRGSGLVFGLVAMTLVGLVLLGWQWLSAADENALATRTPPPNASPTTAASATPELTEPANALITLAPDAIALAVVSLPPGAASAAVYDEPQGSVIATVPDKSIVQVLRGRETTPDGTVWVEVRLLTGLEGWMVDGLLGYLTQTTIEATPAASPDDPLTLGTEVTVGSTGEPASTRTATQPAAQAGTPTRTPAGQGAQPPTSTTAANSPAATTAPTNAPPNTPVAPPPTNTSVPPTNTSVPPSPVPPTNSPVPPPTDTQVPPPTSTPQPPPTPTPGLVCTLLPILCP